MTDQPLEQQLAEAHAENERLRALLPPEPSPGQRWRTGTKVGRNLYLHEGDDPVGRPVGQMASDQLAAFLSALANAYLQSRVSDRSPWFHKVGEQLMARNRELAGELEQCRARALEAEARWAEADPA